MTLHTNPWSHDQILSTLATLRSHDLATSGGGAFAYVYDPGELAASKLAAEVYMQFLGSNGLDPTAFPSLLQFENEVVGFAASHLGGGPEAAGNFTSGGTESLILAVKTAREWASEHRPQITAPEMVLPATAHAALHKAGHYLGVKPVIVPVDPTTFRAYPEVMASAITENTVMLAASAASYAHGVVDPIAEIGALAQQRGLLLHVDACIGGLLLPYFRRLGAAVPAFDLSVPGVTSISMDFHKYGYAPKGASVIVYRDKALRRHQMWASAGWTGYTVINATVQSTKSGGPLAATWALLHALGDAGYLELARKTLAATRTIAQGVAEIPGLRILGTPEMSLLAFVSDDPRLSVFALADAMKTRGWLIQPQFAGLGSPQNVHLTISAGHQAVAPKFLADLRAAAEEARTTPPDPQLALLMQAAQSLDFTALSPADFSQTLALAGVTNGQLPDRLATINTLLNALPASAREAVLLAFLSDLYRADLGSLATPG